MQEFLLAKENRNCSQHLYPAANRSLDSREKGVRKVIHLCADDISFCIRFCHRCIILRSCCQHEVFVPHDPPLPNSNMTALGVIL